MAQLPVYVITDEQYARIEAAFGDRDTLKDWIHNAVIDQTLYFEAQAKRVQIEQEISTDITEGRTELEYKEPQDEQ